MADDEIAQRAIIDEALKKGALVWLKVGDRSHARWHAWTDGHVYLLTGAEEQPDPGLSAGEVVRVVVRSKDTRHRLIAFDADVSELGPDDADWDDATSELAKARLNLTDGDSAVRRWATAAYTLYRLRPRLPLAEAVDDIPDASHRETPYPTSATTSARRPWVLHRRHGSGRPLS